MNQPSKSSIGQITNHIMRMSLGWAAHGLALLSLAVGFGLKGLWVNALLVVLAGAGWLWWALVSLKTWVLSAGLVLLTLGAVIAVIVQVPLWVTLFALTLGVVGDGLLRFHWRYAGVEMPTSVGQRMMAQAGVVGVGALALGTLALTFEVSLNFWPLLGLAVLALVALIWVFARVREASGE